MKMKHYSYNKNFFIILIIVILLGLFILITFQGYINAKEKINNLRKNSLDMIDQRMNSLFFELNNFPRSIGNDLLFLTETSSLSDFINSSSIESKLKIENDFLRFLEGSYANYRLGLIDKNGQEMIRAEFDGESHKLVYPPQFEDFKNRDVFLNAIKISNGEAYISDIYLIKKDNLNIPIMGASMPIYREKFEGVIYLDLYIDYFLEDIRNFQREGEIAYLINKDGFYLANPEREKEFSYLLENDYNFYKEHPEISAGIFDNFTKSIESENYIYSFKYLTPTAWDNRIYSASEKLYEGNMDEKYLWILVSVSDKKIIENMEYNIKKEYLIFVLFSALIISIAIILIFFVRGKNE